MYYITLVQSVIMGSVFISPSLGLQGKELFCRLVILTLGEDSKQCFTHLGEREREPEIQRVAVGMEDSPQRNDRDANDPVSAKHRLVPHGDLQLTQIRGREDAGEREEEGGEQQQWNQCPMR